MTSPRLPVVISFTAPTEKEFIFNLQCNIKKKTTPLTLNVKAMGHSINVGVSAINDKGEEVMLASGGGANRGVDFGKVINSRTYINNKIATIIIIIEFFCRYQ